MAQPQSGAERSPPFYIFLIQAAASRYKSIQKIIRPVEVKMLNRAPSGRGHSRLALLTAYFCLATPSTAAESHNGESPFKNNNKITDDTVAAPARTVQKLKAQKAHYDLSVSQNPANDCIKRGDKAGEKGADKEAAVAYRQAVALLEPSPSNRKMLASVLVKLANVAISNTEQHTWIEGESLCKRAILLNKGEDLATDADALYVLAEISRLRHDLSKAESLCRKSLALANKTYKPNSLDIACVSEKLASILQERDKSAEAEPFARCSLEIIEKSSDHSGLAGVLLTLALICESRKDYQESEHLFARCISEEEKLPNHDELYACSVLEHLAYTQRQQGRDDAAKESYMKALSKRSENQSREQTFYNMEGSPNYEHHYKDGVGFKKIGANGITVEIAHMWFTDCNRIDLQITNATSQPIDVHPNSVRLFASGPPRHELKQIMVSRFMENALMLNTVEPGSALAGRLCFAQTLSGRLSELQVVIGRTTFCFR